MGEQPEQKTEEQKLAPVTNESTEAPPEQLAPSAPVSAAEAPVQSVQTPPSNVEATQLTTKPVLDSKPPPPNIQKKKSRSWFSFGGGKPSAKKERPPEELVHIIGNKVLIPSFEELDQLKSITYPVKEPFQYVNLSENEGEIVYRTLEPQLTRRERIIHKKIITAYDMLVNVGTVLVDIEDRLKFLEDTYKEIIDIYNIKLSKVEYQRILYFIDRDYVRYGKADLMINDRFIEDISCNGPENPVYVYHRFFESIRSNVVFQEVELNNFILRLAQLSGRHISILQPIRDAALPDGSRVNMTLGKEVTKKGSTFTIRKFRAEPISPIEIATLRTASTHMLAFLWLLIEYENSFLISGGTASGKTTLLNAVSMLIRPDNKIVSVEDSVTRDAEILVKEEGSVRKVQIGDFVDDALRMGSERTRAGHELARKGGLEVLTSDASGKSFWSPCTALIRHLVNKEFVKITTNSGKRITVTADHSLFSLGNDGTITEVLAGNLVPGSSFVVAPGSYPQETATRKFDLDKLAAFSEFVFKAPESSNDNGNGLLLQQMSRRVHAKHSPLSIPSSLAIDEDIAFLAGLWLADGFYGHRTVGFSVEAKRVGPRLEQIAKKLGINLTRHSDGVSLLMNSKPLRTFFETVLGLSGDDYSRCVPDLFLGVDERVLASLLRGYFTGDGSASASEIEVESASRALLCDIQTLLLRFGLILNVGTKRKIGSLGGVGTYRARIVGASQIARFKDLVGFEDNAKTSKILPGRKVSKYSLDPIPLNELLEKEIRARLGGITQTSLGQRLRHGLKRHVVQRQSLLELGRLKPAYQQSGGYELAQSGFYFDRVVSAEKGRREEMVYDLSVPETGRFIANNILCHNTPEINLAHPNWIQAVTRIGFGEAGTSVSGVSGLSGIGPRGKTAGDITLYDLLIAALRQRPDYIIVGEVRGEEAYTLFQAISVGHAAMGTIHAASMPELLARVESMPMNVPRVLVANLDVVIFLQAVRRGEEKVRRVRDIVEILGIDQGTKELITNPVFRWDPLTDEQRYLGRSFILEKIAKTFGVPRENLDAEVEKRKKILDDLKDRGIMNYKDVTERVRQYYMEREALAIEVRAQKNTGRLVGDAEDRELENL